MRFRNATIPACLIALTLLVGCTTTSRPRVSTFVVPRIVCNMPKRVVIVPFEATACRAQERRMVTESLANEMQGLLMSEIVMAPAEDSSLCGESGLSTRAVMDVAALIQARKRYRADAFLFGTITRYRPYDPPALGLKLRMIAADSGELLWAAETLLDATNEDVRRNALRYFHDSGLRQRDFGEDLIFNVPQYYATFASATVVNALKKQVSPESVKEEER